MEISLPFNWKPRNYQLPAWNYFEPDARRKRGVSVWHRRAGKDLFAINLIAKEAHKRVGTYWHLFPTYRQAKNVIWQGKTKDGRPFLSHFPEDLVESTNGTDLRVTFKNGSAYQLVGTDNIDSLVGTNPIGAVFSEYSIQDPSAWDYIRPILAENDGWALFIYTARGKNHGFKLYEMAKANPRWFCQVLRAGDNGTKREDGSPVISDATIDEERASGMDEAMIGQEYFCSFDAPMVGAYYGSQMAQAQKDGRITKVPWEPKIPVNTFWDLGIGDSTSIWFSQTVGMEEHVIDYYEASGEGLAHYANLLKGKKDGYERFADYIFGTHWAPHDIEARELGSGKSRIETARGLGIKFRVVPRHNVEDGIEAVRNVLPTVWFDEKRCDRGIECLRSYRKEWDDRLKVYRDNPLHDWSSHGADAFRMFAWSRKDKSRHKGERQTKAVDDFNYLTGTAGLYQGSL